jgi:hypothetical protein
MQGLGRQLGAASSLPPHVDSNSQAAAANQVKRTFHLL